MRKITSNSEIFVFLFLICLSTALVGGLKMDRKINSTVDPNSIVYNDVLSPTPNPAQNALQLETFTVNYSTGPGLHGAFIAETPEQVDLAHAAGMNYIINYNGSATGTGDPSTNALDPNTDLGKEFIKWHMKSFLDLHQFITYDFNNQSTCALDNAGAQNLVEQALAYKSSTLGGYWIKDDDVNSCTGISNCTNGTPCSMKPALEQLHTIIRTNDPNKSHIIMAGYGELSGLKENYEYGIADVLAFYPYPSYDGDVVNDSTSNGYIPAMAKYVQHDTLPSGKSPPPFIGVYQAFWSTTGSPCNRKRSISPISIDQIIQTVESFVKNGAIGLNAFSIGQPCDVNQTADNDLTPGGMHDLIFKIQNWIQNNQDKFLKK